MLKTILLLSPIYVTLFWGVVLNSNRTNRTIPQSFLGKYMIAAFIVYLSHFIFHSKFIGVYLCIDVLYQYASLMVYPMFYIYVRLLTADRCFSFRKHFKFIFAPSLLILFYLAGVITLTSSEYEEFVFVRNMGFNNDFTYLTYVFYAMRVVSLIQVAVVIWHSHKLIIKYQDKAAQYYSDAADSKVDKLKLQNCIMFVMGCTSIVLIALGRGFFVGKLEVVGIAIASLVFSSMLFILGWLGNKQSIINPTYEPAESEKNQLQEPILDNVQTNDELEQKLTLAMQERKAYLNPKLNIRDLAQLMGTNRTTLSVYINNKHTQNYCSFVNNYRIQALTELIKENPTSDNYTLVESCGFGSIDSMKRAVFAKTGKKLNEWKKEI